MATGSDVEIPYFDALPEEALRVIMLALPVDARAQAACVCRSWRAFLADPSLWQVLDLTDGGGVAAERFTANLMRGAVARAAGHLRSLSFDWALNLTAETALLVDVIVSDGAELQHVYTDAWMSMGQLNAVLAAAPRLQVLNTNVKGLCMELLPVLRNDPPYGPLHVSQLKGFFYRRPETDVLVFAAAIAAHESLTGLSVMNVGFARGLNALIEAATNRRVSWLEISGTHATNVETAPALAHLLQRGSLIELDLLCTGFPHAQEENMPVLCAALRECRTLTLLQLYLMPLHGANRLAVTELLDAVAALPALSVLDLSRSVFQDTAAAGRALAALLSTDMPSLRTLSVLGCHLGDEGVAALLDGLAANTHLRWLDCEVNDLSDDFKRDRLEPALAALAARAELDAPGAVVAERWLMEID
jgi:hypothetical protein